MLEQSYYRHVAQTSPESIALKVSHAEGIYLIQPDGRKIIDFVSGICVSNLGHAHPAILKAIHAQADTYLHPMVYGEVIMAPQVLYAQRLAEELGEGLDYVYFGNSGAEAIEGALKVAKKFTGRQRILSFNNAYHGSTHGALSISGNDEMKAGYGPLLPQMERLNFNAFSELNQIDADTAAVVIEPVQGAGGVVLPAEGYLKAVEARCKEVGALLILDEIQTGFGRTGSLFAFQDYEIRPDILVLAKALGGGLPLGAFISSRQILGVIQRKPVLGHISTFGGHPLSCAAGLAAFDALLDSDLLRQLPAKEAILQNRLVHPAIQEVRGKGLLYAILFESYSFAEAVRKEALNMGLLTIGFLNVDHGLRMAPPLTISIDEIEKACDILLATIEKVANQRG